MGDAAEDETARRKEPARVTVGRLIGLVSGDGGLIFLATMFGVRPCSLVVSPVTRPCLTSDLLPTPAAIVSPSFLWTMDCMPMATAQLDEPSKVMKLDVGLCALLCRHWQLLWSLRSHTSPQPPSSP